MRSSVGMGRPERLLAITAVSLAVLGCAEKMTRVTRAIERYEALLRVEASPDTSSPVIGEALELTVTLSNIGDDEVNACLGPAKVENFLAVPRVPRDGKQPLSGRAQTMDHPFCERRFQLGPGENISWRERVIVPDIGEGETDLFLAVQVVHPRDCDPYGCYDTMIRTPFVRLSLRESSTR